MSRDLPTEQWEGSSEDAPQSLLPPRGLGAATDDDSTPKSEVPVAVNLMTPGGTQEPANLSLDATASDYFTLKPSPTESQHEQTRLLKAAPGAGRTAVTDTHSTNSDDAPESSQLQPTGRPLAQTAISNFSIDSSDSAATLRPVYSDSRVPTLPRPAFPNQSYAALHSQHHPQPHLPPASRRVGTKPHQIFTFSSAIASLHANGTRSAISSPSLAPSVGLFSLGNAPFNPPLAPAEPPGTYASPFLHFTHRAVPKETHVADVEKDPISGRKLINEYEIMDELGRGTHGKVKIARDLNTDDTHVAIKIVERFSKRRRLGKLSTTEDKVKKEVAILKKARHPNVVALLEVIDDPSRKKVYIVLEWVERGEIFWRHKPEADFRELARLEARRYEREKSEQTDPDLEEEDLAVYQEARRRLAKAERRRARQQRKGKQHVEDHPAHWSMEFAGESDSEGCDDDLVSRISSSTTAESTSSRGSPRGPMHLSPSAESQALSASAQQHYLTLTYEPNSTSSSSRAAESTGLEGTMYGPYEPSEPLPDNHRSPEELSRIAKEILDSDLDSELEYVPVMTMEQIRGAFRDTLLGLQYLHYQGIVHRDIKPPNLLMTKDNRVKISDFGVSYLGRPVHEGEPGEDMSEHEAQDLDDEAKELAKTVGTPAFYAPELCITDPTDDPLPVTKAIDVWALGITLFCMLFARTPFVDSEFVVMRQIADEDVYIPRQRLRPVDVKPKSRSSSHSRNSSPMTVDRRAESELAYEEVGIELHDLLTRLLIKDPRRRITLEEVRHHPWVLIDLADPSRWLEQTNPNYQNQGKKIEVSKEELNTAVVPLQFLDNIKSTAKKITESLLGLGKSRGRATSSAGSHHTGSPAPSASSSSSAIHQDARRHSILGDESIFSALKASREINGPSHTRSLAASPDHERRGGFFDTIVRATLAPSDASNEDKHMSNRPTPQRAMTVTSTAGSVRTVKQSDFPEGTLEESPPPSPGVPGTPMALASPGGHSLGGLLGGASRHIMRAVRERSAHGAIDRRSLRSSKKSLESLDSHAEPSLALSQTNAAGSVQQPEALREPTPSSSAQGSPFSSRPVSVATSEHLNLSEVNMLTRLNSQTSNLSGSRVISGNLNELASSHSRPHSRTAPESSPEDWERADQERVRRLVREMQDEASRAESSPRSTSVAPESEDDGATCPPSPDDHRRRHHYQQHHQLDGQHRHQYHFHHHGHGDTRFSSTGDNSNPETSNEASPSGRLSQLPPAMLSSSSDLGSAVSMSISNPSVPSAISEASSFDAYQDYYNIQDHRKQQVSSDETLNRSGKPAPSRDYFDEGYVPDEEAAIDSDYGENSESSSDSDGGLVMSRRKSAAKQGGRSGLSIALEAQQTKERRNTGLSVRSKASSRSGSNSTMKKVLRRGSEEDNSRPSLDVHAE